MIQPKEVAEKKPNTWLIVSIILAIALIGVFANTFFKGSTGGGDEITVVSADEAADGLVSFLNQIYGPQLGTITKKGVTAKNGLYEVVVSLTANGQPVDQTIYISRDGKLFIPQIVDIQAAIADYQASQQQQNTNQDASINQNTNTNQPPVEE